MMRSIALIGIIVLCAGAYIISAAESYTYDKDITPVLSQNGCVGCHNWADSYDGIISKVSTSSQTKGIPIVTPAKPDSSVLVWRLDGKLPSGAGIGIMPMGEDKLDDAVITKVREWIAQGAPESVVGVEDARRWGEIKSLFR